MDTLLLAAICQLSITAIWMIGGCLGYVVAGRDAVLWEEDGE